MTNIPKNKNNNCQTHIDGKLNGAHVEGIFGSENMSFPITANGPNPKENQIKTKIYAKGINFFFALGTPATSDKKACFFSG